MPTPRTIAETLKAATTQLADVGIDTARLDAEVLLRFVLGLDRTALLQRLRDPLPLDHWDQFTALVARRAAHEPVAYVTGYKEFMGLPFAVTPDVLIPRPETELLVEWALGWLSTAALTPQPLPPPNLPPLGGGASPNAGRGTLPLPSPRIGRGWLRSSRVRIAVDVGTGSGAIALGLAARLPPEWRGAIIGTDISLPALRIASQNRYQLGLDEAVAFVRGDLLSWCGAADLALANLPYLRPEQVAENPELAAEPESALLGGTDGLVLIRRLVADLPRVLRPGGGVALEIDPSQAEAMLTLLQVTLPTAQVEIHPDLAGLARVVTATTR